MKQGIVRSIQGNGTWEGKYGLMYQYEMSMDNGDTGQYSSKNYTTPEALPFKVGDEIYYEFQGGNYPQIKRPSKENPANKPAYNKSFGGKRDDIGQIVGTSMAYAKDLVCAGKLDFDQIAPATEKLARIQIELQSKLKQSTPNSGGQNVSAPMQTPPPPTDKDIPAEIKGQGEGDLPF